MANTTFNMVAAELERHVGDILANGITKKALQKVGTTPDLVTPVEMCSALDVHITPTLTSFMSKDRARELARGLKRMVQAGGAGA